MRHCYYKLLQVLEHSPTVNERFWACVERTGDADDCWLWRRESSRGEERLTVGQFSVPITRLAWYLATGNLPDGGRMKHRCGNERCVRATHLIWEVRRVNSDRLREHLGSYPTGALLPPPSTEPFSPSYGGRMQYVIRCIDGALGITTCESATASLSE